MVFPVWGLLEIRGPVTGTPSGVPGMGPFYFPRPPPYKFVQLASGPMRRLHLGHMTSFQPIELLHFEFENVKYQIIGPITGTPCGVPGMGPYLKKRPRCGNTKWCSRYGALVREEAPLREHQVVFPVWGLPPVRGPVAG